MWGVLRRPSWIAFTLLVVVLSITFVELGRWQWHRHDERAESNDRVAASLERPAVPVDQLLAVGVTPSADIEWQQLTAVGEYDADHQLLVRNRPYEGEVGFEIITPLVTADGTALLVDRGWTPAGDTATAEPTVPAPPAGEVSVVARVKRTATGDAGADGLPAGQVRRVAVPEIAAGLPYPVYGGYVALMPGEPGTGTGDAPPRALTPPELSGGPHLAYAVQWWLFVLIAVGGYVVLLRTEFRTAQTARADVRREALDDAAPPRVRT